LSFQCNMTDRNPQYLKSSMSSPSISILNGLTSWTSTQTAFSPAPECRAMQTQYMRLELLCGTSGDSSTARYAACVVHLGGSDRHIMATKRCMQINSRL
jgi:hypothetical protein